MSQSFLYDLYFGNIAPWRRKCEKNPAYTAIEKERSDIKAHFKQLLSDEDFNKLEEMEDLQAQSDTIEEIDLFAYGFCMATRMMMDVFTFRDNVPGD